MSDNRMSVVHEVQPADGLTVCCGRSLLELPLTVDPSRVAGGGDLSRAAAVVELPGDGIEQALVEGFGQARWDAMNGAEQHDARDLFGPMAVSIAARVRAEAREGTQASSGDLWPPASSYHWRCAEGLLKLTRWDEWRSWGIRRQGEEITKLAEALSKVIPEGDVGRYVTAHVAAVRAKAVAGEQQRIVGLILACIDRVPGVRNAGWEMGMRKAVDLIYEAAGLDASGKPLAAGSVPAATPEPVRFKDTLPIEVHEATAVAYVRLSDAPVARTGERVKDVVLVDYASDGYPVGVEIHFAGPVATPTEPATCDHGRPQAHLSGEVDDRLLGICPGPAASPVPAEQPQSEER